MSQPSTSRQSDETECGICFEGEGRYTCPRCNIKYCSFGCFKKPMHVACSEDFYKDWVGKEIMSNPESVKKMYEILQNSPSFPENFSDKADIDSDDSDDDDDLESRLVGIDLDDDEKLWDVLTEEERSDYVTALQTTRVTEMLPDWTPWWIDGNHQPILASNIPFFGDLTNVRPSPIMPFLVMDTIMAYQLSLRVIKGQSEILSVETATMIYRLSPALRGSVRSSSLLAAANMLLSAFNEKQWDIEFPVTLETITQDLKDLTAVSSLNVLLALSHIIAIFTDAIDVIRATKKSPRFTGEPPKKSELDKTMMKLRFFISWAKEMDDEKWDDMVGNMELITTG